MSYSINAPAEDFYHDGRSWAKIPATTMETRTMKHLFIAILATLCCAISGHAEPLSSKGQLLYVPAYSEIYYGDQAHTLNLSATLSIRNADRRRPLRLLRVDYVDSKGKTVRSLTGSPRDLAPLESVNFAIAESDRSGGMSPSFIVDWDAGEAIAPPVVEAIMISTRSNQGISFSSTARVLEER